MKKNYQKELDRLINEIPEGQTPSLLLHACCAPCSSYVLEYLSEYYSITVYYYNPNITEEGEYIKRINELKRLIREMPLKNEVIFMEGPYDPEVFFEMAKGMESLPEGGERCYHCYELRMREAARIAAEKGFDYYTTTLSISPHKNADWINEIGERLATEYAVHHLPSDFKKRDGYKRSIELSAKYDLYRQSYCGCVYSKNVVI
ncbi:MAG: epoxyqueuosine reductase QueH [Lachnospiraceae bacterium]|nr:epoxyqueuosine reductase QueH [Lachnospiraceae bacterium]